MTKDIPIEELEEAADNFSIAYEFDPHSPEIAFGAGQVVGNAWVEGVLLDYLVEVFLKGLHSLL